MRGAEPGSVRVQVYLSDTRLVAALEREARRTGLSLSQTAGRALARGLHWTVQADAEDRLLKLERSLRDHMRATARDMVIVQELVVELARAFFLRLPDVEADEDPLLRAAVDIRIERLLDATAARILAGGSRSDRVQAADAAEAAPRSRGDG